MKRRTASYWSSVGGVEVAAPGRETLELDARQRRPVSGGVGRPGHHVLLLAGHPQHGPAGDDDVSRRAGPQQGGDVPRGVDDLLEVVEDDEQALAPQRRRRGRRRAARPGRGNDAQGPRDRRQHQRAGRAAARGARTRCRPG